MDGRVVEAVQDGRCLIIGSLIIAPLVRKGFLELCEQRVLKNLELTNKEFELLFTLAKRAGENVLVSELIGSPVPWQQRKHRLVNARVRVVIAHVHKIRRKLDLASRGSRVYIQSCRGGYRVEAPPD